MIGMHPFVSETIDSLWTIINTHARPMSDVDGMGLALPVALLFHSCTPNCYVFSEGGAFFVRTTRAIQVCQQDRFASAITCICMRLPASKEEGFAAEGLFPSPYWG